MKKLNLLLFILLLSAYTIAQTNRGMIVLRLEARDHIALVIGNSNYPDMPLKNPKNDANLVAQTFTDMGFIVDKVIDADREQMAMAIDRFTNKLRTVKAAVFYFAGHGMQVKGENYLLPIGRTAADQITTEAQVPYRAINAGEVLSAMEQNKVKFSMVVLDACRNNPIESTGRGKVKGLAAVNAPVGSIVMYATKAGDVAMDGTGKNSPFTTAFVKHIKTPGLDVALLPVRVTKTVRELTNKKQTPGTYVQLTESFTFVPEKEPLPPPPPAQTGTLELISDYTGRAVISSISGVKLQTKDIWQGGTYTFNDLPAGIVIVNIYANSQLAWNNKIYITGGQTIRIKAENTKGSLQLESQLSGNFYIDGIIREYINTGTQVYKNIAPGSHTAKIESNGQTLWTGTFNITVGRTTSVKAEKPTINTPEGIPEMVFIKGGTFQMGSYNGDDDEKPVHSVTVSDFYIGKYEVTHEEFIFFLNSINCNSNGSYKDTELIDMDDSDCAVAYRSDGFYFKGSDYAKDKLCPVIEVTWHGASEYCKWLSQKTGKNYRLPTEAEWEYAAGGGSTHQKWSGTNSENSLGSYAWYWDNANNKTQPVGSKNPNSLGLHDMSGNVWEWCSDWYGADYYSNSPNSNPQGPSSGSFRVLRGGGWNRKASFCRVAIRGSSTPSFGYTFVGFRVALR